MLDNKKQKNNKRGFSILELILAIFVLTIGITGALKLIVSTIKTSIDTRNSVIASGLAQEGVELLRNRRDNAMLAALADLSLDSETSFKNALPTTTCIDIDNKTGCGGNYVLYFNPAKNTYSHDSTSAGVVATIFRRQTTSEYVDEIVNGTAGVLTGADVVVKVWWDGTNGGPSVTNCNQKNKCILVNDFLAKRD